MNIKKTSIIIPLYNKENSINRTIKSVLDQTYSDFEVVIINDGSTDNSVSIIESNYKDRRIRVISQQNAGVSAARNRGVKEAVGEWIVFLDADDIMLPNCLEVLKNTLVEYDTDIASANYYMQTSKNKRLGIVKSKRGIIKNNLKDYYQRRYSLRMGCAMIRKSKLININFPEHISRGEDECWILELCKNCSIAVCADPVLIYTCDNRGLSILMLEKINQDSSAHFEFKDKCFWEKITYGRSIMHNVYNGIPFKYYLHKYNYCIIAYCIIALYSIIINKINNIKFTNRNI